MSWRAVTSPKHPGAVFLMDGKTFVAKCYAPDGDDIAKKILRRINGKTYCTEAGCFREGRGWDERCDRHPVF